MAFLVADADCVADGDLAADDVLAPSGTAWVLGE
jgi:hypothetical protein